MKFHVSKQILIITGQGHYKLHFLLWLKTQQTCSPVHSTFAENGIHIKSLTKLQNIQLRADPYVSNVSVV